MVSNNDLKLKAEIQLSQHNKFNLIKTRMPPIMLVVCLPKCRFLKFPLLAYCDAVMIIKAKKTSIQCHHGATYGLKSMKALQYANKGNLRNLHFGRHTTNIMGGK